MENTMAYDLDITPNYSYIFEFENDFIHHNYKQWMAENWTVAFYYVGIYMAFIFGGQHYMQNRPRWVFPQFCVYACVFLAISS